MLRRQAYADGVDVVFHLASIPGGAAEKNYALGRSIKGLKLGLPKEYMIGGMDPEVKSAVDAAVKRAATYNGTPFLIVQVIDWEARPRQEEAAHE